MRPDEARALFERHDAILEGHFELTSGRHSDRYVRIDSSQPKAKVHEQVMAELEARRAGALR